ncbi:MAG: OB-fold domain-containing protein [Deltaproteobacteria bacterium]|nr:OB-fold domain-containing protein [Deltaproteobacteria bacterium]
MRDQDFFWEGVRDEKILVQRCDACGSLRQPPGPMCPRCQSLDWHPKAMSGRGTVYAFILSKHPTRPDDAPRLVVLVDLEEGVRMVSNLVDVDVRDVRIGMSVEAIFRVVDGATLPLFRMARGA